MVESEPGVAIVVAVWMLDPVVCSAMALGTPAVDLLGLTGYHQLLKSFGLRRACSDEHPIFSQRFEVDAVAPIGSYNKHDDINQSSGFWSINPNWALTFVPAPGFEISSRLHYLYNFTNGDPAGSGPAFTIAKSYQAGAAIWDNFAASYTVAPGLDVGINGYYFQQIAQDKVDGVTQTDSETTNLSIGPGLTYAINHNNFLFANAYLPVVEKNTTDGFHTVFRWVHIF